MIRYRGCSIFLIWVMRQMAKKETISKILVLKNHKKLECEIETKKALDAVDNEEKKLTSLKKRYDENKRLFNEQHEDGTMDVERLRSFYELFSDVDSRIGEQKQEVLKKNMELQASEEKLIAAHQEEKVFEKMKEKVEKKQEKQRAELEQKENDFIAISRKSK